MKKAFLYPVLGVLALVLAFPAMAAKIEGGSQYVLGKGVVVNENLYVGGQNIVVNGEVVGDLISAGQEINVFGKIAKDATIAGANLNLMGEIGEDLRAAGGTILIGSNINGDALVAGGEIQIAEGVELKGDTRLAGGNIVINGNISGPVKISADKITINGKITKDANVKAGKELVIGEKAVIEGNFEYSAPKEATIASGAKIAKEPVFKKLEVKDRVAKQKIFMGVITTFFIIKLIAMILTALLFYWLFWKWVEDFAQSAVENLGREAVRGFIFLFVIPIAIIFSFVTIIGLALGFMSLFVYIATLMLGGIFSGILAGGLLAKYAFGEKQLASWKSILLGTILLGLVALIPYVGWIICFIIFLASFGTLLNFFYQSVWKK